MKTQMHCHSPWNHQLMVWFNNCLLEIVRSDIPLIYPNWTLNQFLSEEMFNEVTFIYFAFTLAA